MGPGWGCLEPPSRPAPSDRQEPRPEETSSPGSISQRLDHYYGLVKRQLLRHQSPTSHLFPATSTDTEVASIRDSLYCASAVWALGQAYRRLDDDQGKSYELGQAAVACMRGVLAAWTKQSRQLEEWKVSQNPALALHTVVGLHTGEKVVEQYHHLQLDCTSLFLLYLVQMTTAGLEIVYSLEEVALVQNLVYYIERAYRTPDFGTWGRGTKYNDGSPEVHASSIGMAKAALEAVNGFNLFGERGTNNSVIYADIDAHNRNRAIFEALLPRESSTKNTDASLLCAISYPAFATQSVKLYKATKERVVKELSGGWGFKRFVRDGFGTELEEQGRRYYNDGETIDFQGVENEWPIFYIFMIIDGVFKELPEQVTEYRTLLDKRLTSDPATGDPLVPRMYSVPKAAVQEERKAPHSVKRKVTLLTPRVSREEDAGAEVREASPEVFLWGQAVYIIAELLQEGLLHRHELDPIRRYLPCHARHRPTGRYSSFLGGASASDLVIQVVMIAESARLQATLANYGITAQTVTEVEPVQIWPPAELVKLLGSMGANSRLGLGGRPARPIGSLGTSKVYRVAGRTILCYPIIFSASDFYLSHDVALLIEDIREELRFISKSWRLLGRPTFCIMLTESSMADPQAGEMVRFLAELRRGACDGVKVRLGRLQSLVSTACIEHLDFLPDLQASPPLDLRPLEEEVQGRELGGFAATLADLPPVPEVPEDPTDYAGQHQFTPSWEVAQQVLAWSGEQQERRREPAGGGHVYAAIQLCGLLLQREGADYRVGEQGTVQEVLEELRGQAGRLRHWAALRHASSLLRQVVDSLCPSATQILVNGKTLTVGTVGSGHATEFSKPFSPLEIRTALYSSVAPVDVMGAVLQQELILACGKLIETRPDLFRGMLVLRMGWLLQAMEVLQACGGAERPAPLASLSPHRLRSVLVAVLQETAGGRSGRLLTHTQLSTLNGCLARVPEGFYDGVFLTLQRCRGGITFRDRHLPHLPTVLLADPTELAFSHLVDSHLATGYPEPRHRGLTVRLLAILATVLHRNPELRLDDGELVLEEVLESARALREPGGEGGRAWRDLSQAEVDSYLARAVGNLLLGGRHGREDLPCKMQ